MHDCECDIDVYSSSINMKIISNNLRFRQNWPAKRNENKPNHQALSATKQQTN